MTNRIAIAIQHEVEDLPIWRDQEAHGLLLKKLEEFGVVEEAFAQLISAYRGHAHKQRARGLTTDFDEIFMSLPGGE